MKTLTLAQARKLTFQAHDTSDWLFEILEDMKPNSRTYKRLFKAYEKAHARWMRREKQWIEMGGSYHG